jgi:activator of HSP90 ATPase
MGYAFELTCVLPATPEAIYDAWLSSAKHAAMTGGDAKASKRPGGAYEAWDGYITGRNVELIPSRKIVQTWRTSEFPDDHADSTLTVTLTPMEAGTKLTLNHSGVPDDLRSYEQGGWRENYFEPMQAYFASKHSKKAGG